MSEACTQQEPTCGLREARLDENGEGEPLVVNVAPSASEAAQLVFDHHLSR